MINDKTVKKIIDLLESIQLSESFSTMRHVPTEYTLTLKTKLRNLLDPLSNHQILYLDLLIHLGEENPSNDLIDETIKRLVSKLNHDFNKEVSIKKILRKENLIEPFLRGHYLIKDKNITIP